MSSLIKKVIIRQVSLPMHRPFRTGFGEISTHGAILLELQTRSGLIGLGEAPVLVFPFYKSETMAVVSLVLKEYFAPKLLELTEDSLYKDIDQLFPEIVGHYFSKFAVDCALLDLRSQVENKTSANILGANLDEVPLGSSIGIANLSETLKKIEQRLLDGVKRIKLKIHPGWDSELLEAVREKFGEIALTVDGNSSYARTDIEHLKSLDRFNLQMIEQPFSGNDLVGHSLLQKSIRTAICLDESVEELADLDTVNRLKSAKIINIKPARVGGIYNAVKMHEQAQQLGLGTWVGGLMETGIGKSFALVVAGRKGMKFAHDVTPPLAMFKDDFLKEPINANQGLIAVPKIKSMADVISWQKIDQYSLNRTEVKK